MNQFVTRRISVPTLLAVALFAAAGSMHASPVSAPQAPAEAAIVVVPSQHQYQNAAAEAGSARLEALRECARAAGGDRLECSRALKTILDRGTAEAKLIHHARALTQACVCR
jgi:hypothetical protein